MDSDIYAKFPFLKGAHDFVDGNNVDMDDLMTSPSFAQARERGLGRIMDALENGQVSYVPTRRSDYDNLMEVLSYPYARMIVSSISDRFLTKRYALAEAVRMNTILNGEPHTVIVRVSEELGVPSRADEDGHIRIHFSDFLKLSSRLKSTDWKLINTNIRSGTVYMEQEKFNRLIQNAFQDKIESELPLMTPPEYAELLSEDVEKARAKLVDVKTRFSPNGGAPVNMDFFPPCIKRIIATSRAGMNLPHSARFALVSFLHTLGMSYPQIIAVFAESPDFDESKSEYQIKHITGELSGGDGYTPPECKTMRTNGLCMDCDALCDQDWMNHPLTYYRVKAGVRYDGKPAGDKEQRKV